MTPAIQPRPKPDDRDRTRRDRGQDRPERQRQGQQHERLGRRGSATASERLGRPVARTRTATAIASSPDASGVRRRRRRPSRASGRGCRSARRSGRARIASATPRLEVAADRRSPDERGGHGQHEAEHECDQDQDLRDADRDLELARCHRRGRASTSRSRPQPTSATDTIDRMARTHTTRRRTSSRTVSRAMTITGWRRGDPGGTSVGGCGDELEEAGLERSPAGLDGMDTPAGGDERRHEVGDPRAVQRPDDEPLPVGLDADRTRPAPAAGLVEIRSPAGARRPTATTSSSGPDAIVRPAVEDDDPVADALDLGQQVRVEDDRRAAIAGGRGRWRGHRFDRSGRAPRSARRAGSGLVRQAARRPGRAVAASPSRSPPPGRRRVRSGPTRASAWSTAAAAVAGAIRASSAWSNSTSRARSQGW